MFVDANNFIRRLSRFISSHFDPINYGS